MGMTLFGAGLITFVLGLSIGGKMAINMYFSKQHKERDIFLEKVSKFTYDIVKENLCYREQLNIPPSPESEKLKELIDFIEKGPYSCA